MTAPLMDRRSAMKSLSAAVAAPMVYRAHASAAPSETVLHASFGAAGMAGSDIGSLTASKNLKLVAVAEVDDKRIVELKKKFPDVKVYKDWRELLDKEKKLDSVNVSTPDHMHAPITMRAMRQGLHVYTQKPLTQTIHEARQLTKAAANGKVVTQMGIQIHSHEVHKSVVATIQSGVIGKIKEVHSWSGKGWGDNAARPDRKDPVPDGLDWNLWLGVAADRPFLGNGYYHPGNWRKRLDFGTGTFGDMGCHILDPVFGALALTSPKSVRSEGPNTNADNWTLDVQVQYLFPGTKFTTDTVALNWYNGASRPPAETMKVLGDRKVADQGSLYIGTEGVMYSPYIAMPVLIGGKADGMVTKVPGDNHYLQFVEAVRGNGKTSAPFAYAGPLTESVLLGCLATRFTKKTLEWDTEKMLVTNEKDANKHVRKEYRKGWEIESL